MNNKKETGAKRYTDEELDGIRSQFLAMENYTFLNAASVAPLPTSAREAMNEFLLQMSKHAYLKLDDWVAAMNEAREVSARMIGASPAEIAFTKNTSDGVSIVAEGLRWEPGDEVIINDLEFPANVYPWLNIERKGVVVKTIKSSKGRVTLDSIANAVTSRTRLVAVSSVQYSSGFKVDLAGLGAMARERGFKLFVDAIQSLGVIPMDVKQFGVDFLSAGGFKWLCGPLGSGIFYCDENNLESLDLTRIGWNSVVDSQDYTTIKFTLREDAQRFEEGSPNMAGVCGLLESMKLLLKHGIERNQAHVISVTDRLIDGLRAKGCSIHSPMRDDERSGIVIFGPANGNDADQLARMLADEKVIVIRRADGIRVSPHFYNNNDDIDKLLKAIK